MLYIWGHMTSFTDQTGNTITLNKPPCRIVSLVPSQTELLHDIGLSDEVIGITKFCIHPAEWFRNKTRVGGTKQLNIDSIHRLQPDLIIANKEENVKEQVEELARNYPVWISDINNLEDAYTMMNQIGLMTSRKAAAEILISQIKTNFTKLPSYSVQPKTAYLIWQKPYMTIGNDTFIHSMLQIAGFKNIFSDKTRYPEITITDLQNENCELLLLSSEPFPFKQKHIEELQPLLPSTKIILADGEIFSWYGSRLLKAPDYFINLHETIK
jgi:ABC-type Fe3+-hydroxamate transport system substrate-binding protein